MRKIIVNSTPLIALAKANKMEILKGMYEHIIIPEARIHVGVCRDAHQLQRQLHFRFGKRQEHGGAGKGD